MTASTAPTPERVIAETRAWLRHAVIGLNLCPFARGVENKGQVRYVVSNATDPEDLLTELCVELQRLADADPDAIETTLLMHPQVLSDFLDFNDFLEAADAAIDELDLGGELQIASFHPDFQFDGTEPDDVTNATNRSPWPTLHLLREDSIDRAVEAFPEAEAIFETNMATMDRLGSQGWADLKARCREEADRELAEPARPGGADAGAGTGADGGRPA